MKALTSEQQILLETLKRFHVGRHKSITSRELRHIGKPRDIRRMVHTLRVNGYPVCSGQEGYYYAANSDELEGTLKFLGSYLDNVQKARDGIWDTYCRMRLEEILQEEIP